MLKITKKNIHDKKLLKFKNSLKEICDGKFQGNDK